MESLEQMTMLVIVEDFDQITIEEVVWGFSLIDNSNPIVSIEEVKVMEKWKQFRYVVTREFEDVEIDLSDPM
jgi:hypothetical protein